MKVYDICTNVDENEILLNFSLSKISTCVDLKETESLKLCVWHRLWNTVNNLQQILNEIKLSLGYLQTLLYC